MDCPTHSKNSTAFRFSNFREQFLAATETRRTLTFRRFIGCFLQACTMATWSSRADPSTQSWRTRALVCSYRRVFRSMSIAFFRATKNDRWTLFLRTGQTSRSRYVGATQDLSIAWHVDRHTAVRFLAAYYEVWVIPSRN